MNTVPAKFNLTLNSILARLIKPKRIEKLKHQHKHSWLFQQQNPSTMDRCQFIMNEDMQLFQLTLLEKVSIPHNKYGSFAFRL